MHRSRENPVADKADWSESTDDGLVRMTLSGDHEAYRVLVGRYQGHAYGLAYSMVGDWAEAQDIAQETFIRAYSNLDQLRDPGRFAAWLRRVAFGVAMNWLKTFRPKLFEQLEGRVDLDQLEIPDFRPGPPEVAQQRELADAVLAAVAQLPPKYRVPLAMFHLDGLSYKKVADFLDIPLGTAKSLISRAQAKLRAVLTTTAKELIPMVQEVFNEHKLPEEFASKVLENVPVLAWGRGKECTFAGALEAATAPTEHPCKYPEIMGWTGLAFRVRWFAGNDRSRWCASCAVGEMEEEIAAAAKATGWQLRVEVHMDEPDMSRFAPAIVASIDAGKPVPAYGDTLDVSVIYGYREGGKTLVFRDYHKGEQPHELPVAKLGWLWMFLGEFARPMERREALVEAMRIASHNWRRGTGRQGPGEYWYGDAALDRWIADLAKVDRLSEADRKQLFFVSWWNFTALIDARKAAVAFLRDNLGVLDGQARQAVARAVAEYEREVKYIGSPEFTDNDCFVGPRGGKGIEQWSADARARERRLLTEVRKFDAAAVGEMEKALAAMEVR